MTKLTRSHTPIILLVAAVLIVVGTAGGAAAAKLITGKDVKNNSLTGKDVKNGSLGANELSASAKKTLKGNAGAAGAPGTPGISGYENVVATSALIAAGGNANAVLAYCPKGKRAIGGGVYWSGLSPLGTLGSAGPFKALYAPDGTPNGSTIATATDASGWAGSGHNGDAASHTLYVWVTCANVS